MRKKTMKFPVGSSVLVRWDDRRAFLVYVLVLGVFFLQFG